MFKTVIALVVAVVAAAGCATSTAPLERTLATAASPISFDGNVTGQPTNMVFVLNPDSSPATPGFGMQAGDTLRLTLPQSFRRNPRAPISADTDRNLVLTKGWPQRDVHLAGQYRIAYDEAGHAMVVTATRDIAIDGANAPGIKVIHLRGETFIDPAPGSYPVTVTHAAADGHAIEVWKGHIDILAQAPQARLAPTDFQLAPPLNSTIQRTAPGQLAPLLLGVLLWDAQGKPMNGVGIAPRDLVHYPRYTGGLLVQDTNGDHRLDPAVDKVVGGIIGAAPQGATGQSATSPLRADGTPLLSGEVLRSAGYPAAMGGGKPNPGLLAIQFKAGDKPGWYRPTVDLIGGNGFQFAIKAKAP
ncbi:MAG: hypothetical protein KGJ30_03935 [Burkholderiales bacterium]|nr:hypothetical protein [Burkholderiales bacterium]